MSVEQVAVNHRALRNAAEKVAAIGYTGDAHRFVESLVLSVLADGYRAVEKPPAPRGPGASVDAREAAKKAAADAVRKAKEAGGRR